MSTLDGIPSSTPEATLQKYADRVTRRWRGRERVVFATAQGMLPVAIEARADGRVLWLEPPLPVCAAFEGSLADILGALGLAESRIGRWARPRAPPAPN